VRRHHRIPVIHATTAPQYGSIELTTEMVTRACIHSRSMGTCLSLTTRAMAAGRVPMSRMRVATGNVQEETCSGRPRAIENQPDDSHNGKSASRDPQHLGTRHTQDRKAAQGSRPDPSAMPECGREPGACRRRRADMCRLAGEPLRKRQLIF